MPTEHYRWLQFNHDRFLTTAPRVILAADDFVIWHVRNTDQSRSARVRIVNFRLVSASGCQPGTIRKDNNRPEEDPLEGILEDDIPPRRQRVLMGKIPAGAGSDWPADLRCYTYDVTARFTDGHEIPRLDPELQIRRPGVLLESLPDDARMFDKPYVTCDMNKVEVRNHGKHVIHAVDIGSSDDATIS